MSSAADNSRGTDSRPIPTDTHLSSPDDGVFLSARHSWDRKVLPARTPIHDWHRAIGSNNSSMTGVPFFGEGPSRPSPICVLSVLRREIDAHDVSHFVEKFQVCLDRMQQCPRPLSDWIFAVDFQPLNRAVPSFVMPVRQWMDFMAARVQEAFIYGLHPESKLAQSLIGHSPVEWFLSDRADLAPLTPADHDLRYVAPNGEFRPVSKPGTTSRPENFQFRSSLNTP